MYSDMNILVACEESGIVRDAFLRRGHNAISCDLVPSSAAGPHIIGDALDAIASQPFDLLIAFPPCTHLASSGARWFPAKRADGRQQDALQFVRALIGANIPQIAIENPVGVISTQIQRPSQIIQPWQFGEDASKKTCLWLQGLPLLTPTNIITRLRYANQTPSGQNKLGPSPTRAAERSRTYQGIADAMAEQWG
jgi:site-specific DNA-cytosine methylase